MLILTRKSGEKVVLRVPPSEDETRIEICYIDKTAARGRIGIDAPREVDVMRKELEGEWRGGPR